MTIRQRLLGGAGRRHCGASPGEINEAIIQAAMYLGFPKAVATVRVFKSLDL